MKRSVIVIVIIFLTFSISYTQYWKGGDGDGFTLSSYGSSGDEKPLPVELLSFNASINENTVLLTWSTMVEMNCDFFSIEKSLNGIDWAIVASVKGAGNSHSIHSYHTVDKNPYDGNSLYRLGQQDINGGRIYLKIVNIGFSLSDNAILLFPNPVSDRVFIMLKKYNYDEVYCELINTGGEIIKSGNLNSLMDNCVLNISDLKNGLYYLRLNTKEDGVYIMQLMKQ